MEWSCRRTAMAREVWVLGGTENGDVFNDDFERWQIWRVPFDSGWLRLLNRPRLASSCAQVVFAIKIRCQPAQRAQLSFRKRNETSHVAGRPLVALFGRNNEVLWMWRCTEERRPKAQRFNGESGEVNFDKGDDQSSWEFFFDLCRVIVVMVDEHYVVMFAMWRHIGWDRHQLSCWSCGASINLWCIQHSKHHRCDMHDRPRTWRGLRDCIHMGLQGRRLPYDHGAAGDVWAGGVGVRQWQLPEVHSLDIIFD